MITLKGGESQWSPPLFIEPKKKKIPLILDRLLDFE